MTEGETRQDIRTVEQIVDGMSLFDDDLMSMVFDGNTEATELLLRIILKKNDIKVVRVVGQREFQSPIVGGRNIRLDILAKDSTGKYYNRHNPDIGIMSKCRKNQRERICAGPDSTAA